MTGDAHKAAALVDPKLNVRAKIAALWASVTLCYLYGDVIGFYRPGSLQNILDGNLGYWPASQELLLAVAVVMAAPAVMVFLSLVLAPGVARWLNVLLGAAYSLIMVATMVGAWSLNNFFYLFLGVVEVVLTGSIVWYALRWPRQQMLGPS